MSLKTRIERLGHLAPRPHKNEPFIEAFRGRMGPAIDSEPCKAGCAYWALLEVWYGCMLGREVLAPGLALLHEAGLAEELLGVELLARLDAGEDATEVIANDTPVQREALHNMMAGYLDLLAWIDKRQTEKGA